MSQDITYIAKNEYKDLDIPFSIETYNEEELLVHAFLLNKNKFSSPWIKYRSKDKISLASYMIFASDYSLVSKLYTWGPERGYVKLVNNVITEYYVIPTSKFQNIYDATYISINLITNEPIEYYKYDYKSIPNKECKYSLNGIFLQENMMITDFNQLPEEYQILLNNYSNKDKIFIYSRKPYGLIVEVRA